MCINEAEGERESEGGEEKTGWLLTFGCGGGKELLWSYIRHLEKQEDRSLVEMSDEVNFR